MSDKDKKPKIYKVDRSSFDEEKIKEDTFKKALEIPLKIETPPTTEELEKLEEELWMGIEGGVESCVEDLEHKRLHEIQSILSWEEEERVGLHTCAYLGKLPVTKMEEICKVAKDLPEGIDIYVVGGLASKGTTRHDIDIFIDNKTDKSKDEIDKELTKILLKSKGRVSRVYNLDKFEEDMTKTKELVEEYDRTKDSEVCDKMNPILEIHSHCKIGEKAVGYIKDKHCECTARLPIEIGDKIIYKLNKTGCKKIVIKER